MNCAILWQMLTQFPSQFKWILVRFSFYITSIQCSISIGNGWSTTILRQRLYAFLFSEIDFTFEWKSFLWFNRVVGHYMKSIPLHKYPLWTQFRSIKMELHFSISVRCKRIYESIKTIKLSTFVIENGTLMVSIHFIRPKKTKVFL